MYLFPRYKIVKKKKDKLTKINFSQKSDIYFKSDFHNIVKCKRTVLLRLESYLYVTPNSVHRTFCILETKLMCRLGHSRNYLPRTLNDDTYGVFTLSDTENEKDSENENDNYGFHYTMQST